METANEQASDSDEEIKIPAEEAPVSEAPDEASKGSELVKKGVSFRLKPSYFSACT